MTTTFDIYYNLNIVKFEEIKVSLNVPSECLIKSLVDSLF